MINRGSQRRIASLRREASGAVDGASEESVASVAFLHPTQGARHDAGGTIIARSARTFLIHFVGGGLDGGDIVPVDADGIEP
ncbi:MAG: hypothetical protein OXD42_00625 [Rhodospirillaceae bacterium]|nr:hypothetical protein [Rhodospirillaceae bacterium]